MWNLMKRRHPKKNKSWIYDKYFKTLGSDRWQAYAVTKSKDGKINHTHLVKAKRFAIRRHIKIKAKAHPFNPEFRNYFKQRDATNKTRKT
jgi:RNA-directed DNA polymerase